MPRAFRSHVSFLRSALAFSPPVSLWRFAFASRSRDSFSRLSLALSLPCFRFRAFALALALRRFRFRAFAFALSLLRFPLCAFAPARPLLRNSSRAPGLAPAPPLNLAREKMQQASANTPFSIDSRGVRGRSHQAGSELPGNALCGSFALREAPAQGNEL